MDGEKAAVSSRWACKLRRIYTNLDPVYRYSCARGVSGERYPAQKMHADSHDRVLRLSVGSGPPHWSLYTAHICRSGIRDLSIIEMHLRLY